MDMNPKAKADPASSPLIDPQRTPRDPCLSVFPSNSEGQPQAPGLSRTVSLSLTSGLWAAARMISLQSSARLQARPAPYQEISNLKFLTRRCAQEQFLDDAQYSATSATVRGGLSFTLALATNGPQAEMISRICRDVALMVMVRPLGQRRVSAESTAYSLLLSIEYTQQRLGKKLPRPSWYSFTFTSREEQLLKFLGIVGTQIFINASFQDNVDLSGEVMELLSFYSEQADLTSAENPEDRNVRELSDFIDSWPDLTAWVTGAVHILEELIAENPSDHADRRTAQLMVKLLQRWLQLSRKA